MRTKLVLSLFAIFTLLSCTPEVEEIQNDQIDTTEETGIKSLQIPSAFNFQTTQKINLNIAVKSITDAALPNVKIGIYTEHPDLGGKYINSAFTNDAGVLNTTIQIPTYLEEIFVQVYSIGFANQKTVDVTPQISLEFGGKPEARTASKNSNTSEKSNQDVTPISGNFYYMGGFNSSGLPDYLEENDDELSQEFLDDVNASLPEGYPVPQYNSDYLTSGNELDVVVLDKSDVWVTFVTEGAGYRNALGYYVFDTDNPPSNPSEIDSIFVVLPNASLRFAGGQLDAGNKVKIGTFEGGKSISWVLFQNAWTGSGVNVNKTKFYSKSEFNTNESDPTKRQHTVQLADFGRELLLNGFEDQTRSNGSDNDFNDLVFYVSANPWENIAVAEVPQVTTNQDSDGDGVSDSSDDFPNDPARAILNNYTGSLAYEDLWPVEGDYDFNDLVIDYNIDHILNGNNQLVEIESDWTITGVFATFENGFGVQFENINSSSVNNVTGQNLTTDLVSNNANGTEANQSNATVIFFDNIFDQLQSNGGGVPSNFSSKITFVNPVNQNDVGLPPYNPFIFADADRGKEIHLPGYEPTDLANDGFFGNGDDATNVGSGYTYKTANGLPWAIHLPESFSYPNSTVPITEAYLNFEDWATSGGNSKKDWYLDLSGYRNSTKIFN